MCQSSLPSDSMTIYVFFTLTPPPSHTECEVAWKKCHFTKKQKLQMGFLHLSFPIRFCSCGLAVWSIISYDTSILWDCVVLRTHNFITRLSFTYLFLGPLSASFWVEIGQLIYGSYSQGNENWQVKMRLCTFHLPPLTSFSRYSIIGK